MSICNAITITIPGSIRERNLVFMGCTALTHLQDVSEFFLVFYPNLSTPWGRTKLLSFWRIYPIICNPPRNVCRTLCIISTYSDVGWMIIIDSRGSEWSERLRRGIEKKCYPSLQYLYLLRETELYFVSERLLGAWLSRLLYLKWIVIEIWFLCSILLPNDFRRGV